MVIVQWCTRGTASIDNGYIWRLKARGLVFNDANLRGKNALITHKNKRAYSQPTLYFILLYDTHYGRRIYGTVYRIFNIIDKLKIYFKSFTTRMVCFSPKKKTGNL